MCDRISELEKEVEELNQWVNDLQSGMYINCVYCGHRYGPEDEVPTSMADILKEHVEQCPKHPMSKLKAQLSESNGQVVEYLTRTAKRHSKQQSTARTDEGRAVSGAIAQALDVAADTIKRGEHIALNEQFGKVG